MVGFDVGRFGEDLCVDVCVIDATAGIEGLSQVQKSRRTWELAHAATLAEKAKRRKRRSNDPGGLTMEQRVRNAGKLFYPVGFEILGATTESCKKLMKKLSEKAHDRRGHHKATFYRYWTTEIDRYVSGEARSAGGAGSHLRHLGGEPRRRWRRRGGGRALGRA